jgi:hypothetical protein
VTKADESTVNLTVVPGGAVDEALNALSDNRQKAVEQALQAYAHAVDLTPGEKLHLDRRDGTRITLLRVDAKFYAELFAVVLVPVIVAFWAGVVLG